MLLSWVNFAMVVWASVSLLPGLLWSPCVLCDAPSKLPHCPKLTFKIPLCLISFFLGKVSPLPGCMWEIMFWSVLHGKRLAEECHRWVLPERNWRCRVWRVWRQGRAVLCFFSLPAPSVSSTAKKGVWKQIYWDHWVACCIILLAGIIKVEGTIKLNQTLSLWHMWFESGLQHINSLRLFPSAVLLPPVLLLTEALA